MNIEQGIIYVAIVAYGCLVLAIICLYKQIHIYKQMVKTQKNRILALDEEVAKLCGNVEFLKNVKKGQCELHDFNLDLAKYEHKQKINEYVAKQHNSDELLKKMNTFISNLLVVVKAKLIDKLTQHADREIEPIAYIILFGYLDSYMRNCEYIRNVPLKFNKNVFDDETLLEIERSLINRELQDAFTLSKYGDYVYITAVETHDAVKMRALYSVLLFCITSVLEQKFDKIVRIINSI